MSFRLKLPSRGSVGAFLLKTAVLFAVDQARAALAKRPENPRLVNKTPKN